MGQCTSSNEVFNQSKKSDRQLRTGLKFKDIEFGGFIGYSVTVVNTFTPSGITEATQLDRSPTAARPQGGQGRAELVERIENTEITS